MIGQIFKGPPDSPREVHMAGELLDGLAPVCNAWIANMSFRNETGKDTLLAMSIAMTIELSVVVRACATKENIPAVIDILLSDMRTRLHRLAEVETDDVPPSAGAPDASIN